MNLYGYVGNSVISYKDRDGLIFGGVGKLVKRMHENRNKKNNCPKTAPPDGKCEQGLNWKKDPDESTEVFHGGLDCYRSGNNQCCYDDAGELVDYGPNQGTYDYSSPYNEDGSINIPGAVGHFILDVVPHFFNKNYKDGQTKTY